MWSAVAMSTETMKRFAAVTVFPMMFFVVAFALAFGLLWTATRVM